jgi:hypothetical protein
VWLKQQFRNPLRGAASKAVSRFAEGWAAWTALALLIPGDAKIPSSAN